MFETTIKFFLVAVAIAFALLFAPFACIWSVNTILEQAQVATQIPHNVMTYFAMWFLLALTSARFTVAK
jgi:hypothetical protein